MARCPSGGRATLLELNGAATAPSGHRRRGSRKDFIDLFVLARAGLGLEEVFDLFDRKYGTGRTERYHRLRALAYFDDALREPMPDLLVPIEWRDVTEFFEAEATRLLAKGVGDAG